MRPTRGVKRPERREAHIATQMGAQFELLTREVWQLLTGQKNGQYWGMGQVEKQAEFGYVATINGQSGDIVETRKKTAEAT